MPYPHEHAARMHEPGKYEEIRRQNDKMGPGIDVIFGVLSSGKTEIQAIRFKKAKFTVAQAEKWLSDHDMKPMTFEPAASTDEADSLFGVARFDRGTIRGKVERTPEGYIKADAAVTRTGVFSYSLPDGSRRRELRHPDQVFDSLSLDSLKMVPVTNSHPAIRLLTKETAKQYSIGATGERIRPDAEYVMAPLVVMDGAAVEEIDQGKKRELSCGYVCDLVKEDGEYNGLPYDFRQTNIRYNHVALVDRGRAGADVRLNIDHLDGMDGIENTEDQTINNKPDQGGRKMSKVNLDGIEYEAAPEVIKALEKAQKEATTDKARADAAEKAAETAKAERDTAVEKLDQAEKAYPAKVTEAVKSRLDLERAAAALLPAEIKIDSMSDQEIRSAVIVAAFPEFKSDGKSTDYLAARFDAAVEILKGKSTQDADAIARQRAAVGNPPANRTRTDACDADKARKDYEDRVKNAWKGEKK